MKSKHYGVGAKVKWKWMGRSIIGLIKEVHTQPVTKQIKGKSIKRNGTVGNPAYLVQSEAGNIALKLQTELQVAASENEAKTRPGMFGS